MVWISGMWGQRLAVWPPVLATGLSLSLQTQVQPFVATSHDTYPPTKPLAALPITHLSLQRRLLGVFICSPHSTPPASSPVPCLPSPQERTLPVPTAWWLPRGPCPTTDLSSSPSLSARQCDGQGLAGFSSTSSLRSAYPEPDPRDTCWVIPAAPTTTQGTLTDHLPTASRWAAQTHPAWCGVLLVRSC